MRLGSGELASWVMQHYSAGYDYYLAAVEALTKDELLTIAAHLGAKRRYASDRQTAIRILAEAIATRRKSDFVT